jgi:hypothetical protein
MPQSLVIPLANPRPLRRKHESGLVNFRFEEIDLQHPARRQTEQFIQDVFRTQHAAEVDHFADTIIAMRDHQDTLVGTVGFSRLAGPQRLVEKYLDEPITKVFKERLGTTPAANNLHRKDIVEVGNLTSLIPGGARRLILEMTRRLYARQIRWVAFTATPILINAFQRVNYDPFPICMADRSRLGADQARWGHYYDHQPVLVGADVFEAFWRMAYRPGAPK